MFWRQLWTSLQLLFVIRNNVDGGGDDTGWGFIIHLNFPLFFKNLWCAKIVTKIPFSGNKNKKILLMHIALGTWLLSKKVTTSACWGHWIFCFPWSAIQFWTAFGGKCQGGLAASYVKSIIYNCTHWFIFHIVFFTAANISKYVLHTQLNFEQMKLGIQIGYSCTHTTTPKFWASKPPCSCLHSNPL